MKGSLPDHHDYQRDRDRQRGEHNLNAEPGNGHRPSLRRKLILGIILGSFFYLSSVPSTGPTSTCPRSIAPSSSRV
jgi:hypothetical protein